MTKLSEQTVTDQFEKGLDCSQVVMGYMAQDIGLELETARKLSACFGGGMMSGETCGAITGALMAIGMKYGHSLENDHDQKQVMVSKTSEFKEEFFKKYPSSMCKNLLGHDISVPEDMEKILEKGLLFNFCPKLVLDVVNILEKIN